MSKSLLLNFTSGDNDPAPHDPFEEICDGVDNDLDGSIDEDLIRSCDNACGSGIETCENGALVSCTAPEPEEEVCDGMDNDCDGMIDEEGALQCINFYRDDNQDGYGLDNDSRCLCTPTLGYTAWAGGDCDDSNPAFNLLPSG